ncbi:formate dehydrogenase subunit alpha [Varunaivibrio sulfuroxidans]|uniref:Formate dehydrogenase alpha subunit n=1 Tax=Varunaivibrio sulfuroxidans TaxID=1773489 RepID=A0A4R3JDG7_9PROT|nr:formate dehydrogenase subunit alpha [Varunaivibrio sulfuroxidans]TCS63455.1 formate dehydrogenase alpha subunit [Varunaivibrio sulfuroxidans]WES30399.1 formate dehydrogenase subunit alpha [Varunaivibrio sulfuroxidans]
MLTKRKSASAKSARLSAALSGATGGTIDRRSFLRNSGLAAGGIALASASTLGHVKPAAAATDQAKKAVKRVSSVCTHCSVGCGVIGEVENGVWTRQDPDFDSPFNLGSHCAKGASVREHAHSERRLKYPMKLEGGKWTRISWDQAIDEVGDKILDIRKTSGPDSVYWLGSAKFNNEQSYLFRKFYAMWGSNNGDHQARICHSTTVAGVANTWGYGAMTNSFNDIHNSRAIFLIGSNPAEAHPVSLQHILKAKEQNNAVLIVCDPRFTRTAAHADEFMRFRPGTDVALIWGILWHVFDNEWEDKEFIRQRVWGLDQVKAEISKWTPDEVERVTGVPGTQVKRVARLMASNRPGTFVWCMGGTQHHTGNNNTRAYCTMQLVLGNMGTQGGGANIFRGHDNVQGATDMCILSHSLPGYYGLSTGAWKHWARVWDVDYDWLKGRFASQKLMESKGIPVSRWIDGVLEKKENIDQPDNVRAMVLWGHAVNSQTRLPEMKTAMEKLDLMVVIDPVPTFASVIPDRQDGVYVLPACTQFETYGSVTASNRSIQWRDKVVDPVFESQPDHTTMYRFAKKFGIEKEMFKNIKVNGDEPLIEDITREFNRGMWTIGYTGQSPERLKKHALNKITFDRTTLQARGGPCDGEYYGLPWPCWGTAEMGHPGTPVLYDTSKSVAEGGLTFRARFGVEHNGENLLAEGSYSAGSEIKDGYPEFSMAMLKKLGWDKDLTAEERAAIEKVAGDKTNWKTDLSGGIQRVAIKHGCAPFGNAKARTVVWTFPDPVPVHREPLYTPRRDLVKDYPTYKDTRAYRLPTLYESIQKNDYAKDFPTILTTGRLVEYEGGGEESRSNKWLAELQQEMYCEINPVDANNAGIRDKADMWVVSPEGGKALVKAMVTERVAQGVVFMPFHFGGHWQGKDLRAKYPEGADPYVLGEAANMVGTYGYDSVTQMQETKATLCRVEAA